MNQRDEKELYDLIKNLSRGIKKHGIRKVIKSLKQINITDETDVNYVLIDHIEHSVCTKIGVPRDELYGFASRGEITIARKFCILLIRKFSPYISDENLGNHYNRSRQVVHNTEKEFRLLRSGKQNKFEIDFLKIYNELEKEIQDFVDVSKKNNKKLNDGRK
jgi:chromosomal replication initiation ATPase DnaA